jgi:serpin B
MNKKWLSILFVFVFIGIVSAGIALFVFPYDPVSPPEVNDSGYTLEGIQEVSNANNQFAMDMYFDLSKTNTENLFFSPYSIYSALAMTYEGANGATAEEMKNVFYFPENNILRPNSAAIYNIINKKEKSYELRTGNALWAQKEFSFLPEYFNLIEKYYGGKAVNLDFINELEKSRLTINDFILKQTNYKIKDLLQQNDLTDDTKLVLTNAIYFKGDWKYEFDKKDTMDLNFKVNSNNIIKIPTMIMSPEDKKFNYFENDLLQIIELPYKDNELSMLVLLPKDNVSSLEKVLSYAKLNEWKKSMTQKEVSKINLPKFKFDTRYYLQNNLSDMGMPTAFSRSAADFSKMNGDTRLMISKVIHQAFVSVDEKGTEAAAATAVIMIAKSMPNPVANIIFNADHPFIFIIQENETNEILFLGRMVNPSS